MGLCYPLVINDQRNLPQGYNGPVSIWDIDKTYLATRFSSVRGLTRIPVEFAVDKRAIPGMPAVIQGLRKGPGPDYACVPLYFISASPPQLQKVLEHKMLLDGVEYDGITSKDWLRTLMHLRPRRLREQVGFKLCALLAGRQRRPMAEEYLFGDDVEKDAAAYFLYAGLLSGDVSPDDAEGIMVEEGVRWYDRQCVFTLLEGLPDERGQVKRIFIHLEQNTLPEEFEVFGKLVVPVKGACQLGLALHQMGLIDPEMVREACEVAASESRLPGESLDTLVADARKRHLITAKKLRSLDL